MKELKSCSSCVSVGLYKSVEKLFQGSMKGQGEFSVDSRLNAINTMVQASNNRSATERLLFHLIM